jgi:peptide/nickel transport system substrate-binding protein
MSRALAVAVVGAALVAAGATAATPTPKRGGTLTIAVAPFQMPNCLNLFGPCGLTTISPAITQVLEGAFEVGPDHAFRPNLVSRVEIGRRPFTLTYHIRPEARWSDGVPVTADDFRFTRQVFTTTRLTGPGTDRREEYAKIRSFRVLGPKRFSLDLREPVARWQALLFEVVLPAHALAGEEIASVWRTRIENPRTRRPIGSGPFLIERLEPGRELVLVRNPRYWRRPAHLDRIVLRTFAPDTELGLAPAARSREIDMLSCCFGAADVRPVSGWRVLVYASVFREHLAFRFGPGGSVALRSPLVRRAIAYGVDRGDIARRIGAGVGSRVRPLESSVFLAGEPAYRPTWDGYRYSPERARRLLEQAGCRRGSDGIYACSGERLSLRFAAPAGEPPRRRALELARLHLGRVGIEVQPFYAPAPALFNVILPRGEFDVALFAWGSRSGGAPMPGIRCGDEQNWTGYCSRLVQRDLVQADRIVDLRQRARVLNSADAKLARDVPLLPLYQQARPIAFRARVRGVVAGGTFEQIFERSEDWWLAP